MNSGVFFFGGGEVGYGDCSKMRIGWIFGYLQTQSMLYVPSKATSS